MLVCKEMKKKGLTKKELQDRACLSKAVINRICKDTNGKGSSYRPTDEVVCKVAFGLGMNVEEYEHLKDVAFPERRIWLEGLQKERNIIEVDEILYEQGLPLLGVSQKDE